ISYATEDSDCAEWLALRLTGEGYRVWCGRTHLLGGESYPKDIDNAIKLVRNRLMLRSGENSR
ncbi:MAG: toll/interleukin-1 receptor domain-containing protein, partial [Candidatus Kuenenia stuttgartiensis]|nr:toll/interleukin-1 receptor domain-containing protein [Candidatus Kuenenia stuttgartiensis]